jgi:lipopolysaccharide/colanic/teichoic acid biosynthesis glycosyltransferase
VFSIVGLLICGPLLLPLMVILKLTGEHYIFYLQARIGKNGRIFNVIKFATMLKDSPNLTGGFITQKDDPRVLPLGKFLRTSKINELPQLFNILIGQMSFVGPRPLVERHLNLYSPEAKAVVLSQRPGLTGIASLVFRNEEEILNKMAGDRKVNHDMIIAPYKGQLEQWYAEHKSISLYLFLIFQTFFSVFVPSSKAYEKFLKALPPVPKEISKFM